MPDKLLSPQDRQQLEALVAGDIPDAERRRARLLLMLDDGVPTQQAALTAGITPGRARHWRGSFRTQGMQIFPSIGLAAEPVAAPEPDGAVEVADTPPAASSIAGFMIDAATLKAPGVEADDLLSEAGRKVLRYHFAQMLLHEEGTRLGENIEELHDMRVATRRMRAAFEIFADTYSSKVLKKLLKELRATGRSLGKVRDLDVFIEKALHYEAGLPASRQAELAPLLESWRADREQARTQMVAYLDSPQYAHFKQDYYEFLTTPFAGIRRPSLEQPLPARVREIAPVLIYTCLASVRAFDPVIENASLEQLHALRIEFKKLRYTVEFFREVLGGQSQQVINDLKTIQDHLGDLNDAQVATKILRDFLSEWDNQQSSIPIRQRLSPEPVLAYLSYRYAERQHLMLTFRDTWAHFNRPEFQNRLALAVSAL